jgi:hypothetical protein
VGDYRDTLFTVGDQGIGSILFSVHSLRTPDDPPEEPWPYSVTYTEVKPHHGYR